MLRNMMTSVCGRDICRFCLRIESENNSTPVLPGFFNEMLIELALDMVKFFFLNFDLSSSF